MRVFHANCVKISRTLREEKAVFIELWAKHTLASLLLRDWHGRVDSADDCDRVRGLFAKKLKPKL
jgi:hypothetical protein